jgi:ankyrin repeat protein
VDDIVLHGNKPKQIIQRIKEIASEPENDNIKPNTKSPPEAVIEVSSDEEGDDEENASAAKAAPSSSCKKRKFKTKDDHDDDNAPSFKKKLTERSGASDGTPMNNEDKRNQRLAMFIQQLDPKSQYDLLVESCQVGQTKTRLVKLILEHSDPTLDFSKFNDEVNIFELFKSKDHELLLFILTDKRYKPYAKSWYFHWACTNGAADIVKFQMKELDEWELSDDYNEPFYKACENGHFEVVRLLLESPHIDPNRYKTYEIRREQGIEYCDEGDDWYHNNPPIAAAAKNGHEEVVRLLLDCDRVDEEQINTALLIACQFDHMSIARLLLTKTDYKTFEESAPFRGACVRGRTNIVRMFLDEFDADPSVKDNFAILAASKNGHIDIVRLLLDDPRVSLTTENNDVLNMACKKGQLDLVRIFLADNRIDPTANDSQAFTAACEGGHVDVVKLMMEDSRIDPCINDNTALIYACAKGFVEVVQVLLADTRVHPEVNDNWALRLSCKSGKVEVPRLLLSHPKVDPSAHDNEAFRNACAKGCIDIVKLLLADCRVNPSDKENEAFISVCHDGQMEILKLLLADSRFDISTQEANEAFCQACYENHLNIAHLLFDKPEFQIDPGVDDSYLLLFAAQTGYVEMTRFLLSQPSVDPSANNNTAIEEACNNGGNLEIVQLLMADKRVNPADETCIAFDRACQGGNLDIVKLLLDDPRVEPSARNNAAIILGFEYGQLDVINYILTHHLDRIKLTKDQAGDIGISLGYNAERTRELWDKEDLPPSL